MRDTRLSQGRRSGIGRLGECDLGERLYQRLAFFSCNMKIDAHTEIPSIEPSQPLDANTVYGYINLKAKEYGFYLVEEGNDLTTKKADYLVHHYGIYEEDDYYRATFYDGWITDRGWTDYCVFLHEKSKDGLPVVIFFYNPSKSPDDDLWYVSAYMLRSDLFMGSEGILDDSSRIDNQFENISGWA